MAKRRSESRFRVYSSPMIGGGVGFAGGAWLLCDLVFLAMRKRRYCREIISPNFFRSPMAINSDVNGEAGETCSGIEGRRIVVFFR
jgi:hypothetical protein